MMSDAVEEVAVPKKMTAQQKKVAVWLSIFGAAGLAVSGLNDAWALVEPLVTGVVGYERAVEAKEAHEQINTRIDKLELKIKEVPRSTYDCIKSNGRNCE